MLAALRLKAFGYPEKIGVLQGVARRLALACIIASALVLTFALCSAPEQAYALYKDVTPKYSATQDLAISGNPLTGADVPEGTYSISVSTTSTMCQPTDCLLISSGGNLYVSFMMTGAYTAIYFGSAEEAASLTDETGTVADAYYVGSPSEGYVPHQFELPIPALNHPLDVATYTGGKSFEKGMWYSRQFCFNSSSEIETAIAGGGSEDPGVPDDQSGDDAQGQEEGLDDGSGDVVPDDPSIDEVVDDGGYDDGADDGSSGDDAGTADTGDGTGDVDSGEDAGGDGLDGGSETDGGLDGEPTDEGDQAGYPEDSGDSGADGSADDMGAGEAQDGTDSGEGEYGSPDDQFGDAENGGIANGADGGQSSQGEAAAEATQGEEGASAASASASNGSGGSGKIKARGIRLADASNLTEVDVNDIEPLDEAKLKDFDLTPFIVGASLFVLFDLGLVGAFLIGMRRARPRARVY